MPYFITWGYLVMDIRCFPGYQAKLSNGVTLFNAPSFKYLYYSAVRELKSVYGHSVFFNTGYAELSYGVLTEVYEGSQVKSSFLELRRICKIHIFSCDKMTYSYTERW